MILKHCRIFESGYYTIIPHDLLYLHQDAKESIQLFSKQQYTKQFFS